MAQNVHLCKCCGTLGFASLTESTGNESEPIWKRNSTMIMKVHELCIEHGQLITGLHRHFIRPSRPLQIGVELGMC